MFGTKFNVLNEDFGRCQTTKGIWLSTDEAKNIFIFDIEGTDSKERAEQRATFEQTCSLFALAMADVLLINQWYTDLGRYQGSNIGLLKVILESNLKLFGQVDKKKLIFVIRDFRVAGDNVEKTKIGIEKDMNQIWESIYKPDEYKNKNYTDFFIIDHVFMPHKVYFEEEFTEKCKELKQRFIPSIPDSFFPPCTVKNVPADGLSFYIDKTWQTIKDQKDLNLPD